jgi:hypothetical protein
LTLAPSRSRRRKPRRPSPRELALLAYLDHVMADAVAARLATHVIGMHTGLVAWMHDAERSHVLPDPFRLPGDERAGGVAVGGSVAESREPDDAMLRLVEQRLEVGTDPERLDPVRIRMTAKLGELAGWYGQHELVDVAEWEPLATRLGDLIGDQVAANALALCFIRHARLAYAADEQTQQRRKAARERWRRLVAWYVRVLDEQPTKDPTSRVVVQSVEGEGERRFG